MNSLIIPACMRAAVLEHSGSPMRIVTMPVPTPGPGEALVRIRAVGLNPLDTKIRAGLAMHARHPLPAVLGIDMVGDVVALGQGVDHFDVGDEVFGMTGGVGGVQGALAEYAAVDTRLLARKPAALNTHQAAAVPLAFTTAWEGLVERARVGAGKTVLVHGGAGGVGHMAVQIARAFGAIVHAAASEGDQGYLEGLGAGFIDYRKMRVEEYVARFTGDQGFDIVFDTVGGTTLDDSFKAVRHHHGHVVSALGWGVHSLAPLSFRGATYSGIFTLLPLLTGDERLRHGEIMREAARLADAGMLGPRVDARRFPLEDVEQAYQYLEAGAAGGKVVVQVLPDRV